MPTITETEIQALASCTNKRCRGYDQQPVQAVQALTEYSYLELGGDLPGTERSMVSLRYADLADAQCPHCGEPRLLADQVRPIYPNISGSRHDAESIHAESERVRELELANAQRDAAMAQMQATMERQAAMIDRLLAREDTQAEATPKAARKT